MYLSYYKLSKKPFQISTDPSFFWLGERHKEALSILKYGVMDDKGFLLLTGDVGTGKTTLINAFVNSLGDEVIVSRVSDPGLTQLDFINYIAKMFKIETEFQTKSEFLILFTEFLEQADRGDKKILLIIDEAQHLTDETLEEIRLLSNIENQDKKLLNIFLVGQSEFNETLEKYKNRALRQRLTLNYTLYPFEAEETKACIEYRLRVAGTENEIFTPEAIDVVHTISNGFPRVINIICDHALRLGYQEDQKSISAAIITQCSKTLYAVHLSPSHQHDDDFSSTNQWLEESDVPPLSAEAINRVSQPLPDFIVENEDDIKEKVRPYRLILPLFIAGLLIFGFFLSREGNLASVSKFLTSLNRDTITSIAKEKKNDFLEIVQKIESTLITQPEPSVTQAHTDSDIEDSVVEDLQSTPITPEIISVKEAVEPPSILENETATIDIEFKEHVPVTSEPTATESSNMTEVVTNDVQEKEKQSSRKAKVESVPQDIDSTVVQSKVPSEPQTPTTSKEASDKNDDPGAVIDWLLKSKQN